MSDRHICKAKRTDNGEWVEGSLVKFGVIYWVYTGKVDRLNPFTNGYGTIIYPAIKNMIEPETICRCTGLPDKNGKNIFEWNIVKRKVFDEVIVGKVVWFDIGFCGFYLKCGNSFYPIGKEEETGLSGCDEIIGNIFDNSELLEGGAD